MLGITGTNGKTTTAYLIEGGLRGGGRCTPGVIGTVEHPDRRPARSRRARTTPEATDLQALLAVMREERCDAVAMEVSSHALAYGRIAGIRYDVAAFTNLTQDHLDFHAGLRGLLRGQGEAVHPRLHRARRGQHRTTRTAAGSPTRGRPESRWSTYLAERRRRTPTGGPSDVELGPDGSAFDVVGP